ncbi:MAG: hypothetical protein M0017_05155 [Desulfobacteraceae bacterium]|nr:hypothetical protein [Desulfobacteraceae bacterium]
MSEKEKKKGSLSRADVAGELQAAAADLARGQVRIGRHAVAVGEPVSLKVKHKLKGDMADHALAVKMPVTGKPAAPEGPSPAAALPSGRMPPRSQTETGYGGRKLKREIGRLWKSVSKLIEAGEMPERAETEGLLKRCEEFNLFADGEWQAAWAGCTLAVRKCFVNAATSDWPAAKAGVALVNRMIRECHGKYK